MNTTDLAGVAYSYVRFSSRKQDRGDSVRRQEQMRDAWLARNPGVTLDTSLTLSDLGVSAFRGKHRADDRTALSQFLRAVESGRVRPGSFLVVESLDRLTREELGDAVELVLGIINRGIRIVQLAPIEAILAKPVNMTMLVIAVVELQRGNSESVMKSERVGAAWARKRELCRQSGKLVTRASPAWLKAVGGRFEFKPGAKKVIRRVFNLITVGHGCRAVAKLLNAEGVKPWTATPWYDQYVRNLVRGREALGEFQQRRGLPNGKRENDGDPIPGYYPAAVTEAEWQAAQGALRSRDTRGGRPPADPDRVNVFQGLLWDARSGDRLHVFSKRRKLLLPAGAKHRGDKGTSFPLDVFERGILSKLAELDPREILDRDDGPDEVAELSAKLTRLDTQIRTLVESFDDGDAVPEVADRVRAKNAERKALVLQLDAAKVKAASPRSAAWGECRGLVEALDQAKDQREIRVRLRQALARIIEAAWCLFVGVGMSRIAAVQVRFVGGRCRDYLILHKPAHAPSGSAAKWAVRSFASVEGADKLDLRKKADVVELVVLLAAAEV